MIEHIITLAPYCPVTLYHRWPGVQDGKVGSMSPLPKLRPRVVYFQAAARNPPTTSLARLRIWPFPCPSTQMPELATVSPGWQPWWQRPSGLHPSPPQGCRHHHSPCWRCPCGAAERRWFLAVEAISGIPGESRTAPRGDVHGVCRACEQRPKTSMFRLSIHTNP